MIRFLTCVFASINKMLLECSAHSSNPKTKAIRFLLEKLQHVLSLLKESFYTVVRIRVFMRFFIKDKIMTKLNQLKTKDDFARLLGFKNARYINHLLYNITTDNLYKPPIVIPKKSGGESYICSQKELKFLQKNCPMFYGNVTLKA